MNKNLTISPYEGQKLLINILGNEAPCVTELYENSSKDIIRYITNKIKKRELSNNSISKKAIKFLNQFTD